MGRLECAIGLEPMNERVADARLGRLATRTRLPGVGSNHHGPGSEPAGLPISQPGTDLPFGRRGGNRTPDHPVPSRVRYLAALLAGGVAALATGTAHATTREHEQSSSESEHDHRSPRTWGDLDAHNPLCQHHLLS